MPQRLKLPFLILVTAVLAVLIARHATGMNGPSYWRWPWRMDRGWMPYGALLLPLVPIIISQIRFSPRLPDGRRQNCLPGILLLMAAVLCMEWIVRGLDMVPFDMTRIVAILEEPGSIGYFTHAEQFVQTGPPLREFLGQFPQEMLTFTKHARNKPPGSILFFAPFVKFTDTEDSAALYAGLAIALLATLSVPATYFLVRELTGEPEAAFQAAALMAICPGLSLFFPELDQFFPIYTAAMVVLWAKSLKTERATFAILFGLVFALVCFQTFNLLMLGVFILGYSTVHIWQSGTAHVVLRQCIWAAAIFVLCYALLWLWCGYNPIQTLITGIHTHHTEETPILHRDWPNTIPFDLTDFALGMGWVCVLLAAYQLARPWRKSDAVLLLCLVQPIAVAITGLLATETARVWIFMMPLVLVPAGLELKTWPLRQRLAVMACLWLIAAVLSQNMVFV